MSSWKIIPLAHPQRPQILLVGLRVIDGWVVDTGILITIFHAKNYLSHNSQVAKVIVGSGNLNPAGLARNIENSIEATLDLSKSDEKIFLDERLDFYEILLQDYPHSVLPISDEKELDNLFLEGLIVDEEKEVARFRGTKQKSQRMTKKKY